MILLYFCLVAEAWKCGTEPSSDLKSIQTIHQSRHLSELSWSPIRITYTYDESFSMGSQSLTDSFKSTVMTSVDNFFRSVLTVHPVQGNLILRGISNCGEIPSVHKTVGLQDTDLAIYIGSEEDEDGEWAARAKNCALDGGPLSNVVAGRVIVNPVYFAEVDFNEAMATVIHEIVHILGFSASLYPFYNKDEFGTKYREDEYLVRENIRGKERVLLKFPELMKEASKIFACDDIKGIELEEYGGTGTAGAHWDMRIAFNDFMVGFTTPHPIYSTLTFSLLESTGWYQINYEYLQPSLFGYQQGCAFLYDKCIDNGVPLSYQFCSSNDLTCDMFHLAKGLCSLDWYSSFLPSDFQYFPNPYVGGSIFLLDYCPIREPIEDCRNPFKDPSPDTGETYGPYSRCVLSTLAPKGETKDRYTGCYRLLNCDLGIPTFLISHQNAQIQISCLASGLSTSNSLMDGHLECPDPDIICGNTPCLNNCYGFGICKHGGICQCDNGRGGADCSLKCHSSCYNCYGTEQNQCLSCANPSDTPVNGLCRAHCSLECESCSSFNFCTKCADSKRTPDSEGSCVCKEKYYKRDNECVSCASNNCDSCSSENLCTKCLDNFVLFNGKCHSECPQGHYPKSGICYACSAIDNCSELCDNETGYCLECKASFYPSEGKCEPCESKIGCSDCDPITGHCKECQSSFFLNEGSCYNCSDLENCAQCSSHNGCTRCEEKYDLKGKICVAGCGSLCEICDIASQKCVSCVNTTTLIEGECVCEFGYRLNEFNNKKDECLRCINYFQSSDLSAEFIEEYSAIQISFSKKTMSPSKSCLDLIYGDLSALGKDPICTWINAKTLKIVLGKDFSLQNKSIHLNGLEITKNELGCDSTPTDILTVEVISLGSTPVPKARISGPQHYSLACSNGNLILSGAESSGSSKHSLNYEWVSSHNNTFYDLESKGISITNSKLVIPDVALQEGIYEFILVITNAFFNSDSTVHSVFVTTSEEINVGFDSPSEVEIFYHENVIFTAVVVSDCAYSKSAKFAWSLLSNYIISPNILARANQGQTNNQLQIMPEELSMGYTYYFKASVNIGDNLSGHAILKITVKSRHIVAIIPQFDGDVSSRTNLKLDGTLSYDLNDHSNVDRYHWECFDSKYNPCTDSSGDNLIQNSSLGKIEIPKDSIEPDAYYLFILTVYKDVRENWDYVEIWTHDVEPSSLTLKFTDFKMSITKDLYVTHQLDIDFNEDIAWYQVFGDPVQPTSEKISDHLEIEAYSMKPGEYYSFEAKYQYELMYITQFNWHTNLGPICTGVEHTTYEKNLITRQVISLEECYDQDGEDEPLLYSFAILQGEEYSIIKELQMLNEVEILIPSGEWAIRATVYDQLGDSKDYFATITVQQRRKLINVENLEDVFREEAKNSGNVPMTVFYFTHEVSINLQLWEVMFTFVDNYMKGNLKTDSVSMSSMLLATTELLKEKSVDSEKFVRCMNLVESMITYKCASFDHSMIRALLQVLDETFPKFYNDLAVLESVHSTLTAVFSDENKSLGNLNTEFKSRLFFIKNERLSSIEALNRRISLNDYELTLPSQLLIGADETINVFIVTYFRNNSHLIDISMTRRKAKIDGNFSENDENNNYLIAGAPIRIRSPYKTDKYSLIKCNLLYRQEECIAKEMKEFWEIEVYQSSMFAIESHLNMNKRYKGLQITIAFMEISSFLIGFMLFFELIERNELFHVWEDFKMHHILLGIASKDSRKINILYLCTCLTINLVVSGWICKHFYSFGLEETSDYLVSILSTALVSFCVMIAFQLLISNLRNYTSCALLVVSWLYSLIGTIYICSTVSIELESDWGMIFIAAVTIDLMINQSLYSFTKIIFKL